MSNLNPHYAFVLLAVGVGVAAGLKAVHERHTRDFTLVLGASGFAIAYLVLRSAVPCVTFLGSYYYHWTDLHPALLAVGCGLGSEAIVRTAFHLRYAKSQSGGLEAIHKGPFELLSWAEDYFLGRAATAVAGQRLSIARDLARDLPFPELETLARGNVEALDKDRSQPKAKEECDRTSQEYAAAIAVAGADQVVLGKQFGVRFVLRLMHTDLQLGEIATLLSGDSKARRVWSVKAVIVAVLICVLILSVASALAARPAVRVDDARATVAPTTSGTALVLRYDPEVYNVAMDQWIEVSAALDEGSKTPLAQAKKLSTSAFLAGEVRWDGLPEGLVGLDRVYLTCRVMNEDGLAVTRRVSQAIHVSTQRGEE